MLAKGTPQLRFAAAAAATLGLVAGAQALGAQSVGPDGRISACYQKKGKQKGALRVVPPGKRCKRGERPLTWAVQGPVGQAGTPGAQGQQGLPGPKGAQGPIDPTLEARIAQLETLLAGVSNADLVGAIANASKLNGITAGDLTGAITNAAKLDGITAAELAGAMTEAAKLNGISATELADAVDAVAAVNSLCAEMTDVVATLGGVRDAVSGLALGGVVPAGLTLAIPPLPAALPAYACP